MRRFLTRIIAFFRRARADHDLAREMTSHLSMLEEEYRRRGMSAHDARLAARRAMGSVALAQDRHRDARSFVWLEDLRRDLHHAVRALRRGPAFALLAVGALGLGIGVNTTFFTIVNAICLRGVPIDSPGRVLMISTRDAANRPGNLSYVEFDDLRARSRAFERVGAYTITIASLGDNRQPPARVPGAYISAGAFELLGEKPILGRTFRPDEDRAGTSPVVLLGEELWATRYASDPAVIGQSVVVNGTPTTVIGVMPRGFQFPGNADLWRPMANLPTPVRQAPNERRLAVFARLARGATEDQARVDVNAIGSAWAREFPATNRDVRLHVIPINEQLNPSVMQRGWLAFITAGVLVLLVACANVANLLLMRGAARGREMAIRASIGASRIRIVRQVLVESGTLTLLACVVGLFVAWIGLRLLEGIVPPETLPYWMAFTIDGRVFAVTIAVCAISVLLCGLPSALQVSRVDLRDSLTDAAPTMVGHGGRRWITSLLAAEFAVTLVLVAMAVMSARNGIESRRREFQIDPKPLLTMWLALPGDSYATPALRLLFFERFNERVAASPAIGTVALASALPYGSPMQLPLTMPGRTFGEAPPLVSAVAASDTYFDVLRVPLMRGRAFTSTDGRPGNEAAIVNQRFVQMFLSDVEPLGARIRLGAPNAPLMQIVGVATSVRQQVVGPDPDPVVFVPFRAQPSQNTAIIVRTSNDPMRSVSALRNEVATLDSNLPLYRVMSFEQAVRYAVWNGRLSDTLVKSIAVVALVLALIGIYAVTGDTVQRWTRELGLRMALGAEAGQIGWLVLRRILWQLSIGFGLGIVGTLIFDRSFNDPANAAATGIRMTDPVVMTLIILSLAAIAIVSCVVLIRRAARLDPVEALRT